MSVLQEIDQTYLNKTVDMLQKCVHCS